MSTCIKTSDNKYYGCPPRMSDARSMTDYRPECHINDMIRADNNISNSYQYRQFLQQNADQLMDRNRQLACEKNCCTPCSETKEGFESTALPEKYMWVSDGRITKAVMNNPNGIGHGRKYYTFSQDQDCTMLPSAWPGSKQNDCTGGLDKFHYLGTNDRVDLTTQRVSVPGGGMISEAGDPSVF
jgi:hypothetical protein